MNILKTMKSKIENTKDSILSAKEKFNVEQNKVIWVKVSDIYTDEYEHFLKLDENRVKAIAESIRTEGFKIEHPVICVYKNHKYYLRDGHHRVAAFKLVNKEESKIPVIVKSFESAEKEAAYISDVELLSRHLTDYEFLTLLERKYKAMEQTDQSRTKFIADMATLTGRSQRSIYNGLDVLKNADDAMKVQIENGTLSVNAALSQLKNSDKSKRVNFTKESKEAKNLKRFCKFALQNLYRQYTWYEIGESTDRIFEAWQKNQNIIDDNGCITDTSKVELCSFEHLRLNTEKDEDLFFFPDKEDDDEPPIHIVHYDVEDFDTTGEVVFESEKK